MEQKAQHLSQDEFLPGDQVAVVVAHAAGGPYDYRVAEGSPVAIGAVVQVPFGKKTLTGVVTGAGVSDLPAAKIKMIAEIAGVTLAAEFVAFLSWVAQYTISDPGAVMKLAVPIDPFATEKRKTSAKTQAADRAPDPEHTGVALTEAQDIAATQLKEAVREGRYQTLVLDGVTGAGKTEVYFEAIAEALRQGQQVLVLQPEIALTAQFVERFRSRFGAPPTLWHSGLTPVQRRKTWHKIVTGEARVVVGARSALMLPYQNLGLIIVDEEHEATYKQEDGVLYHARDMAVARGHRFQFPVILASATPSLETAVNMWQGKYAHLTLPDRFGGAVLPDVRLVDLRSDQPDRQRFIAPTLVLALRETLERGDQALLFLNRRGYAPLTLCRACGHRLMCPRCTAWMVSHRKTGRLHCHHCGYDLVQPKNCPSCQETDSFVACGPGVERIEEEAKELFPQARTLVLSSDLADHPAQLHQALEAIASRQIDIIIGTQIIAKGHHFPGLTLVGVIDADLGLAGGDLRAGERTFQLMQQVAGRAGRGARAGTVYLQTYMPENRVIQALAAGARDRFLDLEAEERKKANMPPFSRLVGVVIADKDEQKARAAAFELAKTAPEGPGLKVWGPAEAPIFRLRGKSRFRLLVQADRGVNVQKTVMTWMAHVKLPASVTIKIDVDPQSFL